MTMENPAKSKFIKNVNINIKYKRGRNRKKQI